MIHDENYTFRYEDFNSIDLDQILLNIDRPSYLSIVQALNMQRALTEESGLEREERILRLLAAVSGMILNPDSLNSPYMPYANLGDRRSSTPEDLTSNELEFFESILNDFDNPWVKARLADLLWLCRQPRNPDFARTAIEAYMLLPSEYDGEHHDKVWERAARISLQIRDQAWRQSIESSVLSKFRDDSGHNYKCLWAAVSLGKLGFASNQSADIALRLFTVSQSDSLQGDFHGINSYLTLAAEKYKQAEDYERWVEVLVSKAEHIVLHAEQLVASSAMTANHFFEMAIQAFREIPNRYRESYAIEEEIEAVRAKLTSSGQATLSEMSVIEGPSLDITSLQEVSRNHVANKGSLQIALMFFTGVCGVQSYQELVSSTLNSISDSPLSSLFGNTRYASDGRVSARTEPLGLEGLEQGVIPDDQLFNSYMIGIGLNVEGCIIPALRKIAEEHWVTLAEIEAICRLSPKVPNDRVKLTAMALWLGFEFDFRSSVTLLCPQIENMVRLRLKEEGINTSNVDRNGIEQENGMSTLLNLSEAERVFGTDHLFEMKAIFTNAYGANLRNEVAHGLLNDNGAGSAPSVYAWWMFLRIILEPFITR